MAAAKARTQVSKIKADDSCKLSNKIGLLKAKETITNENIRDSDKGWVKSTNLQHFSL